MSRTFSSKPAVMSNRGRGARTIQGTRPGGFNAGAANARPTGYGSGAIPWGTEGQEHSQSNSSSQHPLPTSETGSEQRMTYMGGFSMISPNEKKRQQITAAAEKERVAYQKHKQQNTPKNLNIVGTVGGGEISQSQARRNFAQAAPNKTQKLLQQQERKSWLKQKEEEEIQKKKAEQRAKAEQNERREAAGANRWDEQRARTNEAFLRRLENKGKKGASTTQKSTSSGAHNSAQNLPPAASSSMKIDSADGSPAGDESGLSSEERKHLDAITVMFPQYSREELLVILEQTDFSLDSAIALLQD